MRPRADTESPWCVMSWDFDGDQTDALHTTRTIYVRHMPGELVTEQMVVDQFTADIEHYPAGNYRIYPFASLVDVTVKSIVMVAA